MFLYERPAEKFGGQIFTSPDGVHWSDRRPDATVGDNTTIFYNPFRKKWIYSVRICRDAAHARLPRVRRFRRKARLEPAASSPLGAAPTISTGPTRGILAMMPAPENIRQEAKASGTSYEKLLKKYRSDYGDPHAALQPRRDRLREPDARRLRHPRGPANDVCQD